MFNLKKWVYFIHLKKCLHFKKSSLSLKLVCTHNARQQKCFGKRRKALGYAAERYEKLYGLCMNSKRNIIVVEKKCNSYWLVTKVVKTKENNQWDPRSLIVYFSFLSLGLFLDPPPSHPARLLLATAWPGMLAPFSDKDDVMVLEHIGGSWWILFMWILLFPTVRLRIPTIRINALDPFQNWYTT